MEIRYLSGNERQRSRVLYEEVFTEDEKAFTDAYYDIKARDNEILVAEDNGEIVSMLHRNPYEFRLRGNVVQADYLVAVATRESYRKRGLMRCLLTQALQDMERERRPFTFLMPAAEAIYTPYDFRWMGNEDAEALAKETSRKLAEVYDLFVEKNDAYDRRHVYWPEWEKTPMMLRLLHLPAFLEQIGAENVQELAVEIVDPILPANSGRFLWKFGEAGSTLVPWMGSVDLKISIADFGSFLFGRLQIEDFPAESFQNGCQEEAKKKLERVRVLKKIYINETV